MMRIAVASSRFSTAWENVERSWAELIGRLKTTTRTPESVAEYRALPKLKQDKIKDVGGFVGGWLKDGKRRTGSVLFRSLLSLDLDFAKADFWDNFTIFNDCAALCYSTHKHTPEAPRLRLLVPLSREVTPEEYEAVARKLAAELGIDQFDDTTYQPARLMYWPSTSLDGEYFFRVQEGEPLDADSYLAKYADWRDVTRWPVSSRQKETVRKRADKAEDPLTKDGLIGAFCRAYGIEEAIEEFLGDVYRPGSNPERYSYIAGSTTDGLVVYDHKYAYSNHATDPAGGRLLNAFDLVRIHRYGSLDREMSEANQSVTKRPSFKAMTDFAAADDKVKEVLAADRMEALERDYPELSADNEPKRPAASGDWKKQLETDRFGKYYPTINNVYLVIKNDPLLQGLGRRNLFKDRIEPNTNLPWKPPTSYWSDSDDANLRFYLEKYYKFNCGAKIYDAANIVFEERSYHPVRDFLATLSWDGQERLDTLLVRYLGAENNPYVRAVTRKTFAAAVARVMEPGCKFDYMLTLVGPQGVGKSTLIKKMAREWYSDTITTVSGKEAYENLEGVWIVEMAELTATRKAEVEAVKQFISKQEDTYRKAYNRRAGTYLRQNIFIGTTNSVEFLRDMTGNRRWWPVDVARKEDRRPDALTPFDLTEEDIRQLWAEAKKRYEDGEPLYLNEVETDEIAQTVQESHSELNIRIGMIEEYLNTLLPADWATRNVYLRRSFFDNSFNLEEKGTVERTRVCAAEILCELFGIERGRIGKAESVEVNDCMRKIKGWRPYEGTRRFGVYGSQRGFYKEGSSDDPSM